MTEILKEYKLESVTYCKEFVKQCQQQSIMSMSKHSYLVSCLLLNLNLFATVRNEM